MKKMHMYYKDFLNCISLWGSEMNYFFKYNFQIYYTIVKNPQTKLYLKHEKKKLVHVQSIILNVNTNLH